MDRGRDRKRIRFIFIFQAFEHDVIALIDDLFFGKPERSKFGRRFRTHIRVIETSDGDIVRNFISLRRHSDDKVCGCGVRIEQAGGRGRIGQLKVEEGLMVCEGEIDVHIFVERDTVFEQRFSVTEIFVRVGSGGIDIDEKA